jgi:opacity protein-like surface antigen
MHREKNIIAGGFMKTPKYIAILLSALFIFITTDIHAAGDGASIGFFIGTTGSSQDDMNSLIDSQNSNANGPISTGKLTSALEFSAHWSFRFGNILGFHLRPSYFYQTTDGSSSVSGGSYDYSITGFTLFPMFRMFLLENNYIKFFTQVGIGWGFANGEIKEDGMSVKFSGNSSGFLGGIGAEFCIADSHCINVEGNFRYLPIERMTVDSSSGTVDTATSGLTQIDGELEIGDRDLSSTMSGIMGVLGYTYYF